ncbi:MAG: hypothetical protein HQ481_02235 [Alphaproteobacteria bacterium]|nr:hypothetical protein [Alphaproteobacteria bacterium]
MRTTIILVLVLGGIVVAALAWAIGTWTMGGEGGVSIHAYVALGLGALGTVALGGGLMALVFFSSRHGYDDEAHHTDEAGDDKA